MIYIFNVDGTISNSKEREKYPEFEDGSWHESCHDMHKMLPVWPTIRLPDVLARLRERVYFISNRPERYRKTTMSWLNFNNGRIDDYQLLMRADEDLRDSHIVKSELIKSIPGIFGEVQKPVLFDDDPQMIEAAQKMNMITCHINYGSHSVLNPMPEFGLV